MNKGHTVATAMSLALVATSVFLTGCSAISSTEIDLPVVSLSATPTPTVSQSEQPTAEPGEDDPADGASEPSKETEDKVSDGFAELEIEDQRGDGSAVVIEEVRQSLGNAILVIFDGQGKVLGSSPVTVRTQPVKVPLSPSLSKSQKLIAQLFLDNGNGTYDAGQDTPILDHDGDLARESFEYKLSQG